MAEHTFMPADDRAILRQQFQDQPGDKHPERWDDLWKRSLTPWDRKGPSLALKDAVTQHLDSPLREDGTRKRAFVPGCGRGYDVLLLASLGYDTYGLDASETAIEAAKKNQAEEGESEAYAAHSIDVGKGTVKFMLNDFFKNDFYADTNGRGDFDLIFDYTFLCALPPELRSPWAKRMSELLAPTGRLVCLEWPLGKPPREGGPPHGLTSELYVRLFEKPGEEVEYDGEGVVAGASAETERSKSALVRVEHFQPERTHEAGKGKDYVSIWKHVEV